MERLPGHGGSRPLGSRGGFKHLSFVGFDVLNLYVCLSQVRGLMHYGTNSMYHKFGIWEGYWWPTDCGCFHALYMYDE